jgi:hypothetical protein
MITLFVFLLFLTQVRSQDGEILAPKRERSKGNDFPEIKKLHKTLKQQGKEICGTVAPLPQQYQNDAKLKFLHDELTSDCKKKDTEAAEETYLEYMEHLTILKSEQLDADKETRDAAKAFRLQEAEMQAICADWNKKKSTALKRATSKAVAKPKLAKQANQKKRVQHFGDGFADSLDCLCAKQKGDRSKHCMANTLETWSSLFSSLETSLKDVKPTEVPNKKSVRLANNTVNGTSSLVEVVAHTRAGGCDGRQVSVTFEGMELTVCIDFEVTTCEISVKWASSNEGTKYSGKCSVDIEVGSVDIELTVTKSSWNSNAVNGWRIDVQVAIVIEGVSDLLSEIQRVPMLNSFLQECCSIYDGGIVVGWGSYDSYRKTLLVANARTIWMPMLLGTSLKIVTGYGARIEGVHDRSRYFEITNDANLFWPYFWFNHYDQHWGHQPWIGYYTNIDWFWGFPGGVTQTIFNVWVAAGASSSGATKYNPGVLFG